MYKDCMITTVSNLGFYGKVLVCYLENNDEKVVLKFVLNKDKSVKGDSVASNGNSIESFNFNTIKEMMIYLEKIRDRIYLVGVA